MNILFLNEIHCFPPNSGEKLRTYNLMHSILEFCNSLHFISGNAPPEHELNSKLTYYQFPEDYYKENRWKNLSFLFKRNRQLEETINHILDNHKIDIAFIDYNFLGNYIDIFKKRNIKVIYGTHNVQSHLNNQSPVSGIKDSLYKKTRFYLEKRHENKFFSKADTIICVSDTDKDFYKKKFSNTKVSVIPNYINENTYKVTNPPTKRNQIIMAANYSAFQNRHGLQWFMENVWDKELSQMTTFVIAGHEGPRELDILKNKGLFTDNIIALGSVEDMKIHIIQSRAAIIPLLHGSGTRLKCIEAMALKTNIVSTTVGVEGIDHNGSILLADNPEEFKASLIKILKNEIHNEDYAYSIFMKEYSSKANTLKLKNIITNT